MQAFDGFHWYAGLSDPANQGGTIMAKATTRKAGTKKVTATKTRKGKAVRLDVSPEDHKRLDRIAKAKGLNMAAYSRMAILERLRKDEEELGS
jgi:hypothetical protein